ncbi:MAG: Ig-like domain-containing protein [Bacteroidales bacterium]
MIEGYYLINLTVSNTNYSDSDEMYVIVSETANIAPTVSITSPENNAEIIEGTEITIIAAASDIDGSIQKVDFYVNDEQIGTVTSEPFSINWSAPEGEYEITAVATDDGESSTISQPITVFLTPAPPCYGTSYNGEFDYVFSPDDNNPTLTFIPSIPGVGSPTCILYYGTNSTNLPGYYVTPNVPYQITADEGDLIYFYYTYSYPGQGEHNNSANPNTYVVGSCIATDIENSERNIEINYYPNPVTNLLRLEIPQGENTIHVYNFTGYKTDQISVFSTSYNYDMSDLKSGIYIFEIRNSNTSKRFKIIKK